MSLITEAVEEIGYTESPAGSNRNKFAAEVGHANGYAWCATFVSAMLQRAGVNPRPNSASVWAVEQWCKDRGLFDQNPRPGDLVFYDFPGGSPWDHIGIVESVGADGSLQTIEGNTSFDDSGSQANGGAVARRHRSLTYTRGFGHVQNGGDEVTPEEIEAIAELSAKKTVEALKPVIVRQVAEGVKGRHDKEYAGVFAALKKHLGVTEG